MRQAVGIENISPRDHIRNGYTGSFINDPKAFVRLLQCQGKMSADKPAAAGDKIGHLLSDRFDELRISKKMSSLLGMNRADVKLRVGEEFR